MFDAIYLEKDDAGFRASLRALDESALPTADVTLRVEYSTINYKDALAITNASPVVRRFPMVAGIDGVGIVEHSDHPGVHAGERVILNGWGVGENHFGCLAGKARLRGEWLVPLPPALSTRQAAAIGTAGYTAMLCVLALERHGVGPDSGEVLVTGAAGGVGSIAVALLGSLGYRVIASTGRLEETAYLKALGAQAVIDRAELSQPGRPLAKERWTGVVDSVGSHTLASACAATRYGGVVTACGLAQGMDFPATVAPFILRAVKLIGVESVTVPRPLRLEAWQRLARDLDIGKLDAITAGIGLTQVIARAPDVLAGRVRGRLVVDVNT
jgi:acrylyl-CoA reductase (NADPH)